MEGDGSIDLSPAPLVNCSFVVSSPLALRFVPLCLASGVHHHSHLVAPVRALVACVRACGKYQTRKVVMMVGGGCGWSWIGSWLDEEECTSDWTELQCKEVA